MLGNKISERDILATLKYNELPAEDFDIVSDELIKNNITIRIKKYINEYTPEEIKRMRMLADQAYKIMDDLSPREERILSLRFGFAYGRIETLEEIANVFAVTRETISEYETKALMKLRSPRYQNTIGNICDILLESEDLNCVLDDEEECGYLLYDDYIQHECSEPDDSKVIDNSGNDLFEEEDDTNSNL